MSRTIFYTPEAKETLNIVYEFILDKFGKIAARNFIQNAEKTIKLIPDQPYMFKASIFGHEVRVAQISKQTSLYYRVTKNSIHLLFFWDNRQEPFT